MNIVQSVKHRKTYTEKEKPVSMKQLQEKYTEEEIAQLLEDEGIVSVSHSRRSSVQMFIDKSNWSKTSSISKQNEMAKKKSAELGNEEIASLEQVFGSFDPYQSSGRSALKDFFMKQGAVEDKEKQRQGGQDDS